MDVMQTDLTGISGLLKLVATSMGVIQADGSANPSPPDFRQMQAFLQPHLEQQQLQLQQQQPPQQPQQPLQQPAPSDATLVNIASQQHLVQAAPVTDLPPVTPGAQVLAAAAAVADNKRRTRSNSPRGKDFHDAGS